MPPDHLTDPFCRFAAPFLTALFALTLPWAAARAAPADLAGAADVLSNGMQTGVSHDLVSLDDTTALDPVAIDPGVAEPGDILDAGVASWYGRHWSGRRTASGIRFNPDALTAASATLPLGTRVLVTLEGTARSVLVTITDRLGAAERVIDLSRAAARKIGILGCGTARVVLRRA